MSTEEFDTPELAEEHADGPDRDPERAPAAIHPLFLFFFAMFAIAMIMLPLRHTMELWDESRNANNAVEMAMRGHWLVPTYGFVTDHWNTKPPLLIWIVALLERMRVAPLAALRLPSAVASLGSVMVVYWFARRVLLRPFAAIAAALLMMSSTLYFGLHVSMSGDYDALLCLFTTVYTLGFFVYAEDLQPYATGAIAVAGVALLGAIMTKGIAGVLPLPGLLLYVLLRWHLPRIVKDWRFWASFGGTIAVAALYYLGRNHFDPGYLHDVWANELGGRFNKANEGHQARMLFYANYLVHHFEPGMPLLLLGWFALRPDVDRPHSRHYGELSRRAAMFTGLVAWIFLLVLQVAKTKIFYYCAPAIPLLSLFAALALADALLVLTARRAWSLPRTQTAVFALLALLLAAMTGLGLRDGREVTGDPQAQYGELLGAMQPDVRATGKPVILLDPGFETNAMFSHYDPIAEYFAKEYTRRGMPVEVDTTMPAKPAAGSWVVSCDPRTEVRLISGQVLQNVHDPDPTLFVDVHHCLYGQLQEVQQ